MALSPDGRWLAAGGWLGAYTGKRPAEDEEAHLIRVYDFQSGELKALLKGHTNTIKGLAFSHDGKKLISGEGGEKAFAIIWDVERGTILHRLEGHTDAIYGVGFTPDGSKAVTGSHDHTLRLWNAGPAASSSRS